MIEYGYGTNVRKLRNMNQFERDQLYDIMKVFPGHRARFNTMIEMLKCVAEDESEMNTTKDT